MELSTLFCSDVTVCRDSIFFPTYNSDQLDSRACLSDIDKCILKYVKFNSLLDLRRASKKILRQTNSYILDRYNDGEGKTMIFLEALDFFKPRSSDEKSKEPQKIIRFAYKGNSGDRRSSSEKIEEFYNAHLPMQNYIKSLYLSNVNYQLKLDVYSRLETLTLSKVVIQKLNAVPQELNADDSNIFPTTITNLTLESCGFKKLPVLNRLTWLKIFGDHQFKKKELKLTSLKSLLISSCAHIDFVTNFTNLEDLDFGLRKTRKGLGNLKKLTNLRHLNIFRAHNREGCGYTLNLDLNDIAGLSVNKLKLQGWPFDNYKSLSSFTNLKSLSISESLIDYSFLENLTSLKSLKLPIAGINNLKSHIPLNNPLDHLTNLTLLGKLTLTNCKDKDLNDKKLDAKEFASFQADLRKCKPNRPELTPTEIEFLESIFS